MNRTVEDVTLEALDLVSDLASTYAATQGGIRGVAVLSVAAIAKGAATAIRAEGLSVDELLLRIRTPRELKLPWNEEPKP